MFYKWSRKSAAESSRMDSHWKPSKNKFDSLMIATSRPVLLKSSFLFYKIVECIAVKRWMERFRACCVSTDYWTAVASELSLLDATYKDYKYEVKYLFNSMYYTPILSLGSIGMWRKINNMFHWNESEHFCYWISSTCRVHAAFNTTS